MLVTDTAFKTWQALILYLYSGDIKFLPLKSQKASSLSLANQPSTIACSPKSMYRLAEKLGLHDLKALALKSIQAGLSKTNILDEAFSKFTSRYPVITEMDVNILCQHYDSAEVLKAFPAKMKRVAEGELPHSATILASLCQNLAKKTPSD